MKKQLLFLSFMFCVLIFSTQTKLFANSPQLNLLLNPGFESWTSGKPDSWTLGTTGTITQSTITPTSVGSAIQISATGTYSITQIVAAPNGTFDTNKKYKIIVNYKTTAGDGTDERVWCNWITSEVGAPIAYWKMLLTDSLGLKGPGGNIQPAAGIPGNGSNGYLISNKESGEWTQYTYSFTPPAGTKQFSFQVRTYNGATVIWDDLYFGEDTVITDLFYNTSNIKTYITDNKLIVLNSPSTVIDIYGANGTKLKTRILVNNTVDLSDLSNGIYFIKIDNFKTKILIK